MQNEEKGNHQCVWGRLSGTEASADASAQDSSLSRQPGPGGHLSPLVAMMSLEHRKCVLSARSKGQGGSHRPFGKAEAELEQHETRATPLRETPS